MNHELLLSYCTVLCFCSRDTSAWSIDPGCSLCLALIHATAFLLLRVGCPWLCAPLLSCRLVVMAFMCWPRTPVARACVVLLVSCVSSLLSWVLFLVSCLLSWKARLGRPSLVRETSRRSVVETLRHPIQGVKRIFKSARCGSKTPADSPRFNAN